MTDQVITLMPGDSLTVNVPGVQAPDGSPQPGTDPTTAPAVGDTAPDAAPDGTPTDPTAEPDGTPDQGGVTEADNAPGSVGAG